MTNDKNKIAPKVCAKCGATLEVDETKENITCPYCRASFNISDLLDESDEVKIEKIKSQTYKDIETQKLKHEMEKEEKLEQKENLENFKKSKLKKWLIPCAIISGLCTFGCLSSGSILAGLIALIQTVAYIVSLLMGYQVIKEKIKYMRILVAIVGFVLIIPFLGAVEGNSSSTDAEKINWQELKLGKILPEPKSNKGRIGSDDEEYLSVQLVNMKQKYYDDYLKQCKKKGFDKDINDTGYTYNAFNKKGYELDLIYYRDDEKLDISLSAPMEMDNIEWPDSKVGKMLPKPKSKKGNIIQDESEAFEVYIGETSKDDYNEYVKACKEKGFDKDYSKEDTSYSAFNKDGYELTVYYESNDIMHISIDKPEEEESDDVEEEEEEEEKTEKKDSKEEKKTEEKESKTDIDPKFKKAMDSYEDFFDEYIKFMKKYEKSGNSMSMLSDYTEYMQKYADTMEKMNEIDEDELSVAEQAYYIEVTARINKKLLEVSE